MKLTEDTNMIVARITGMAKPAAKMECGLDVVSAMNAMNTAVEAYNIGRHAALADRRYQIATAVVSGTLSHTPAHDSEAEDKIVDQAIRIANKLAKRLDEIEQKEFEDFRKLED